MHHIVDRRTFIAAGGAAGLLLPSRAALARLWPATGFTHSVASGDPGQGAITLWTRYVPRDSKPATLRVEVAADPRFARRLKRGEAVASAAADWTAQARIDGLRPGQWVYYRFIAPDGTRSPAGRTKSFPEGRVDSFRAAVFSCSNKPFGWFNAYAHAAARTDIDLVIHLGDYFYEYQPGYYPEAKDALPGRPLLPRHEIVHLDDYRLRYASYRVDPALRELHRRFPWISIWDDHESSNDAWTGGAQNHQPGEGPWDARLKAARQAHHEWLPIPAAAYKSYDIGDLLTLIALDTRVEGRDRQLDLTPAVQGGAAGLAAFHDGPWSDPARTLLGMPQEAFAAAAMKASVASGRKWQLVAQQIVMGNSFIPKAAAAWLGPKPSARAQGYVGGGIAAAAAGIPGNMDSWGGYAPARSRFLQGAQAANADLVVISGDSHNAWAFDLADGGKPAGVEFGGHSVTSPGYESSLLADPATVAAGVIAVNPEMKWCDTSRRGYMAVSFTPGSARCDWVFMRSIRELTTATSPGQAATVARGQRTLALV